MCKIEFILTTRSARGISTKHWITVLKLPGRTSCQRVSSHAGAPKDVRIMGEGKALVLLSRSDRGVQDTQPCSRPAPPCTQERAALHIWDPAHYTFSTDFKVVKFSCRNCYFIFPCTQNPEEGLYSPLGLWLPPAHRFGRTWGATPCLCKALHREHFPSLHIHHVQLVHWNTLDTVRTVCIVSL